MKKFCCKVELWFEENKKELIISALGGVLIGAAYAVGYRTALKRAAIGISMCVDAGVVRHFNPSTGAELKTWDEINKVTKEVLNRKIGLKN